MPSTGIQSPEYVLQYCKNYSVCLRHFSFVYLLYSKVMIIILASTIVHIFYIYVSINFRGENISILAILCTSASVDIRYVVLIVWDKHCHNCYVLHIRTLNWSKNVL